MPKPHTFPTLYDELKTVSISFLSKYGYLKPNQWQTGTLSWSRNGNNIGSISIAVNTHCQSPYLELDYLSDKVPINYKVQMIKALSNLGKGFVWYFICPLTGKRCRKLYLGKTHFYHRSAFTGCMYEKQTHSKYGRYLDKTLGAYFQSDKLYSQLNKKHFKKYYAGKPTKKFIKLSQQIRLAEQIPPNYVERLLIR